MLDFQQLQVANALRQAEWDPNSAIDLSYRGTELGGEVGEALNLIKKLERERLGIRGSRTTVQDLADELADVIICVSLIANHCKFNLGDAVRNKFNATTKKYNLTVFIGEENA